MRKTGVFFILLLLLLSLIPFSMFNVGASTIASFDPNGNGSVQELGGDWDDVDQYSSSLTCQFPGQPDGDTWYSETVECEDHGVIAGTISTVTVNVLTGMTSDGNGDARIICRPTTTSHYSSAYAMDDGIGVDSWHSNAWNTNPDGGSWSWSDIDNLEVGISLKRDENYMSNECSRIYLNVTYTPELDVTTDAASSIEETTVTLSGSATGADGMTCGFWYNTSTTSSSDYGNNVTVTGTFDNSETFTEDITGLTSGDYYYYRAWSSKAGIGFFSDSSEQYFLTKPNAPDNLTITAYQNQLNLSWDNATTGDVTQNTIVRYKTTGYPTSVTDGTHLYNGTSNTTTLGYYTPGTTYYFSLWTYITASGSPTLNQHSDSSENSNLEAPTHPVNLAVSSYNDTRIVLTWTKGDDDTVIVRNTTAYPDNATDGTEVYNGSLETYTDTGLTPSTTYYYRAWNWNGTNYSVWYTNVTQTTEPEPPQNVDSETTIVDGSSMNINVSWDIGQGANRTIVRRSYTSQPTTPTSGTEIYNSTGSYHIDTGITQPAYYTVFSYNTTTGLFSPGVTVDWYVVWISAYNETNGNALSSYSVFFTNEDGTDTYSEDSCSNPHLVNVSDIPTGDDIALQVNATGYKTRVYYLDIEVTGVYYIDCYLSPSNTSELYLLQVLDELSNPLSDVKIKISRYINDSVGYEDVSIEYTDGNGQVTVYLTPEVFYKFNLTKTGYKDQIANWVPSDQLLTHTFVLEFEDEEPTEPNNPVEDISFTFERSGTTLYVNYTDSMQETINTTVYVYGTNITTAVETLLHTDTRTGENSFSFTVTDINSSHSFKAILYYNHSTFGAQVITLVIHGAWTPGTGGAQFNTLVTALMGAHPWGWFQFIVFMFLVAAFHQSDNRDAGIWLVIIGGLFLFIGLFAGTIFSIANGVIPILFIAVGILEMWKKSNRRTAD